MTKKIYAVGIPAVLLLAAGGFVGYEKAQARAFLDKFNNVVDGLSHERNFRVSIDRYREPLLALSKANPIAIKQAFYEIDQIPDTPVEAQKNEIRKAVGYIILSARSWRADHGDDWSLAAPGLAYPWSIKKGEPHLEYIDEKFFDLDIKSLSMAFLKSEADSQFLPPSQ